MTIPAFTHLDLEKVRVVLEAIRAQNSEGILDPHEVVREANIPTSVLYALFEHDASKGLYQYQLEQARLLIKVVPIREVVQTTEIQSVSYYVKDPMLPRTTPGYRPLEEIAQDPDATEAFLDQERARLRAYIASARAKATQVGRPDAVETFLRGELGP